MSKRCKIGFEVVLAVAVAAVVLTGSGASADEGRAPMSRTQTGSKQVARSSRHDGDTAAAWHSRRGQWFQRNWGVDIVGVKRVSSGFMLRFDYRVVDPALASALSDRNAKPYLIDETSHTALAVPAMENIGELRQITTLQANRTYFIIFGNPGGLVKPGGRVTLVIGNFRAEGLIVE
jgi:hypothetical protein